MNNVNFRQAILAMKRAGLTSECWTKQNSNYSRLTTKYGTCRPEPNLKIRLFRLKSRQLLGSLPDFWSVHSLSRILSHLQKLGSLRLKFWDFYRFVGGKKILREISKKTGKNEAKAQIMKVYGWHWFETEHERLETDPLVPHIPRHVNLLEMAKAAMLRPSPWKWR